MAIGADLLLGTGVAAFSYALLLVQHVGWSGAYVYGASLIVVLGAFAAVDQLGIAPHTVRSLFNATDEAMGKAELVEAVKTAEVLVPTVTDRIDKAVLLQAGDQLKLIANFGNGVDNIDVETALSRGITVTNTPGVLTEDTADFTMALMMAVSRRIVEGANVAQLYLTATPSGPQQRLAGFRRVDLKPGASQRVTITIAGVGQLETVLISEESV